METVPYFIDEEENFNNSGSVQLDLRDIKEIRNHLINDNWQPFQIAPQMFSENIDESNRENNNNSIMSDSTNQRLKKATLSLKSVVKQKKKGLVGDDT